ncbi:hypothetical protein GCM10009615_16980 [Corynebacterium durum]
MKANMMILYHMGVPEVLIFTGVRLADVTGAGEELLVTFDFGMG